MKAQTLSRPFPVGAAVTAGLLGGVLLDLKLILIDHAQIPQMWQFIASTMFGPVAFSNTAYALIGLVMHFITSLFWAFAYVLVWSKVNSLRNWIVGGIVWGVVAMLGMAAFLHFKIAAPWPAFDRVMFSSLLGHTLFFGLPVAWYVARRMRASA